MTRIVAKSGGMSRKVRRANELRPKFLKPADAADVLL
jgi:hypothetical protein